MSKAIVQWDKSAKAYAESQECSEFAESNKMVVHSRFSKLHGEYVLDLGCGFGCYTEYFRSIGAKIIGVDGSAEMINIAKDKYPDCDYKIADITQRLPFDSNTFDIVFCNQVLMDIEDIAPIFAEAKRILRNGGTFYFSIVHPAFYDSEWQTDENGYKYAKAMKAYIDKYSFTQTFWGETAHFHRPLSYYLNLASDNGLILTHVEEPKSYDGVRKNKDLPLFIFFEYKKI
ncbi:MAG: Malonyl-(acyl-carrier protein) O-methyltransferase [Firmicutes bacterium ADurb.Bin300]|nr:MAG: Malonyl-(acyl-carrier protein) O-methyltransferase [Firmicutes bacterium ADurb.Bin300]